MMHPKGRIREIFWKELSEHEKTYKPLYNTYSRIRNTHIYTDVQNPFCLWEVWSMEVYDGVITGYKGGKFLTSGAGILTDNTHW